MGTERKRLFLLALVLCAIPSALANSRSFFEYKVAPDFIVRVALGTNPLEGSEVKIEFTESSSDNTTVVASAITNRQGEAIFSNVKPGKYFLSVLHAGMESGESGDLVVVADHSDSSAQGLVALGWPEAGFESTQHLAGRFATYSPDRHDAKAILPKGQTTPFSGSIKVTEFVESKAVGETFSDENGHFDFPNVDEGFFIVEIRGDPKTWPRSWPRGATLLVHVNRLANRQYLYASLFLSDAGMAFEFMDENK